MTEQARRPQQQQPRASHTKDDADSAAATAAAAALSAQVETLRQESEAVVTLLRQAQTEDQINELRSSVERMVGTYSSAWPRLAPRCAALQSSQAALARDLHTHSRAVEQAMQEACYMMRHPSHGVAPRLAAMLEQERKQNEQIAHAQQAQQALALVAEIQTRIHSLLASDSSPSSLSSSSLSSWVSSFLSLESLLASLGRLDPSGAVEQSQCFLAMQQQVRQMREHKLRQVMQAFEGIVCAHIEETKTTEEEGKSNGAIPLSFAVTLSPASVLSLSVVPDPALPLAAIFAALHSLRASSRCIDSLGTALLRLLEPLLAFVASQETDPFSFALHFATVKQRGGAGGRSLRVLCGLAQGQDEDDAAPSMEGTILEVVLTIFDFVWQQIFAAAPAAPPSDDAGEANADRPASMAELGLFVRPRFQSLVSKYLCNASIPRNVAELLSYPARNAAKLREFEQQCLQRGLLAVEPVAAAAAEHDGAAAPAAGPITLFLSQLTSEFEQKVRERVLQHTKQLVLNNAFETKRFGPASSQQRKGASAEEERSVFYSRSDLASAASAVAAASSSSFVAAASASPAKSASSAAASASAAHSLLARHSQTIFARATSYAVSQATWSMLQMLYELMFETLAARDALALPGSTSLSLWSTLRDALVLWSAITPVYRGGEIESILHLSLLVHNDCTFLAKHVSAMHAWITVENKRRVALVSASAASSDAAAAAAASSPAPPQLMLVDLSPSLLDLGSKFLLLHLARHRSLVSELADALVGFIEGGALEDEAPYVAVTQQTKQTMHQLQAVEKTWNQLMGSPASAIATASMAAGSASVGSEVATSLPRSNGWSLHIGLLLESLTSRLVSAVLEKQDISVEGASRLHHLFSLITAPYPHLLPRHTPSWVCFQTVALMLHPDQSLARLSVAFVEGRLNALTPEEIAGLVCALYQDSTVRQKFLQTVSHATGSSSSNDTKREDTASRLLAATEQGAGKAMRFAKHVISSTKSRLQQ